MNHYTSSLRRTLIKKHFYFLGLVCALCYCNLNAGTEPPSTTINSTEPNASELESKNGISEDLDLNQLGNGDENPEKPIAEENNDSKNEAVASTDQETGDDKGAGGKGFFRKVYDVITLICALVAGGIVGISTGKLAYRFHPNLVSRRQRYRTSAFDLFLSRMVFSIMAGSFIGFLAAAIIHAALNGRI